MNLRWIEVEWQGKKLRVPAVKYQGKLWLHWLGQTYMVELNAGARRSANEKTKANPGVITAPMPGKVTRVSVKLDEPVNKGQPLIVMEAMKMEYTLEADRDGKVGEVNVQPGAQVELGAVLVRVVEA